MAQMAVLEAGSGYCGNNVLYLTACSPSPLGISVAWRNKKPFLLSSSLHGAGLFLTEEVGWTLKQVSFVVL